MNIRYLLLLLLYFAFAFLDNINAQNAPTTTAENTIPIYTDEAIRSRLRNIASCVIPRYTSVVKSYIHTYTVKNRAKTEAMLGKTVMYFPLFQKITKEYGLPDALKYLSVTESALNPVAVSSAKAVGLWQFMKVTGKEYGLRIDGTVDERCDPHRSTDAAMRYLQRQYKRFGNWPLAIAAYNSGGGSVSRAIRRGRSKNFWKIKRYLPRETRSYVPAYIAAAYLLQNYEKHNLNPTYPEMDLQLTDEVKVYEELSFQQISAMIDLSITTLRILNPSYKREYIPANTKGNYLILPKRVLNDFNSYFARPDSRRINRAPSRKNNQKPRYDKSYYTVQQGDNLPFLANLFNCDSYHLKVWNDLKSDILTPGQELLLFSPVTDDKVITVLKVNPTRNTTSLPTLIPKQVYSLKGSYVFQNKLKEEQPKKYLYHVIQRNESLKDISATYRIPIPFLLKINEINKNKLPKPGNRIKVKVVF